MADAMRLSAKADGLLSEFARQQGLSKLAFDENGLISIRLDKRMELAVGYSPANDAIFLVGVVDPKPGAMDAWALFARNTELADRRTRYAVDPATGALILVRDRYVVDLEFYELAELMDEFVGDLEAASNGRAAGTGEAPAAKAAAIIEPNPSDLLIFRP